MEAFLIAWDSFSITPTTTNCNQMFDKNHGREGEGWVLLAHRVNKDFEISVIFPSSYPNAMRQKSMCFMLNICDEKSSHYDAIQFEKMRILLDVAVVFVMGFKGMIKNHIV